MKNFFSSKFLSFLSMAFLALAIQSCTQELAESDLTTTVEESQLTTETISIDLADSFETIGEEEAESRTNNGRYRFNTLNQALECTGLDAALFTGSKSIFAPSDAAFAKLGLNAHNICHAFDTETLTNILLYHVTEGRLSIRNVGCVEPLNGDISQLSFSNHRYFINDARIYAGFKQRGKNFRLWVLVIDQVLLPPADNIVATAMGAEDFSSLVAAVVAANPAIAAALSDEDAVLTVFAPTNEAFADLVEALGAKDLNDLVATIGVDALSTVLLYHVVDGCAFSNNLADGQKITTLQGEQLEVDLDKLQIIDATGDGSGLIPAGLDILTSNGIVHAIDRVLLPQEILNAL